jgi:hypothetical protein
MADTQDKGLYDIYRFYNETTGTHFLTANESEKDSLIATNPAWKFEGNTFDSNAAPSDPEAVAVHRFYNATTGAHFYTGNEAEKDLVIATNPLFAYEGINYYAFTSPGEERQAVYRFYNETTGAHFYTSNEAEKDLVIATNPLFSFEGVNHYVGGPAKTDTDTSTENTINLTQNADTTEAIAPAANTTGTSGIDNYFGVFDPNGNATTISNADNLSGADGIDSLNIRVGSVSSTNEIAPVSTEVENFFIQNQVSEATDDSFILNFSNISGEAQVWDKGSVVNALTIATNLDDSTAVGMLDTLGGYAVNFSNAAGRSGTNDAFTLALNGAGTTNSAALFETVTTQLNIDDSFEVANISSTSTLSNVQFGISNQMTIKTVNVSGDAKLFLSGINDFVGLSTVDASALTAGGLQINAQASTETSFNFTGSSSDDSILLLNTTINTAASLNGGNGKDTLATKNFNNLSTSAVNSATSFEVLEGVDGAENFDAGSFTINEFLFSDTTSNNNGFTVSNIETADRIRYQTDISSSGNYALRLEGKNAGNEAIIELVSTSETNGETVLTSNSNNNDLHGIEIRSNISSLTIDSTGTGASANVIETSKSSNDNGYAIKNTNTPTVDITGSHDLVIMAKEGVDISNGQKLDGFFTAVNVNATNFTGALRIAGSSDSDVIKGGAGEDIIYGQNGADTLTGNGGSDQFRLSDFNNTSDIITDFSRGTDKVGIADGAFGNTTATLSGATLSTTDYVDNRQGITNIGTSEGNKIVELQSSLSGSQISTDTGAAVTAYVLVHNTTTEKAELWFDNDWSDANNRDQVITFDNIVDLTGVQSFSNSDFVEFIY